MTDYILCINCQNIADYWVGELTGNVIKWQMGYMMEDNLTDRHMIWQMYWKLICKLTSNIYSKKDIQIRNNIMDNTIIWKELEKNDNTNFK